MKKIFVLLVAMMLALCMVSMAQQPKPIDDDLMLSLTGEWEGWWERPEGKYRTSMIRERVLDGQYFIQEAVVEWPDPYKGIGKWTKDRRTGEWVSHWFDNYRQHFVARGVREGNKLVMQGTAFGGHKRIIEKINDDRFTITVIRPRDGKMITETATYERKKTLTEK